MYAITSDSYRAIAAGEQLNEGETLVAELPAYLVALGVLAENRNLRNELLRGADWTQISDSPLSAMEKAQWVTYRQALRDLPSLPGFPDVPWPVPPTLPAGAAHED